MNNPGPYKPKFEDNPEYNIPDECVHNPKPKNPKSKKVETNGQKKKQNH